MAIHPTATIDSKAEIDESVEIGPYCVIDAHVRVGAGCKLYQGVYLTGWTEVGADCVLHPGAVIGHEPQDTRYGGERSYCRIGRGTIAREYVTIHRGTIPDSETVVGEGCFLLAGSHIAHNCIVGNGVTMINGTALAGHVEVGDRVTIGGGAMAHQFTRIGTLAMIAGGARVPMDVVPYAMTDLDGRIVGMNRVGLRRAGFAKDEVNEIRQAYRVLFARGVPREEAIRTIEAADHGAAVEGLLHFLKRPSERGLAGRTRRGGSGTQIAVR